MDTVKSNDGTAIAYDLIGEGPPVVLISGGLNQRIMYGKLVGPLSEQHTVFNYDRRGRGDSGDGDPDTYTIEREIEDLATVIDAIGEPASVFGNCTGGIIALHAAAAGVPMEKLGLYEPPWAVGGDKPVAGPDYLDRLKALIDAGKRDEAIMMFQKEAVGASDEFVQRLRNHPAWPIIVGLAHTLVYDRVVVGDGSIPADVIRKVDVPTLLMEGGASSSWQRNACTEVANLLPNVQREVLPGQGHVFPLVESAPYLLKFFGS